MPRFKILNGKKIQFTAEEETARDAEEVKLAKEQEDQDTARQTQITKKASAITKLKALGLDDDEISALTGAS
jgi:hypothetical protein